MKETRKNPRSRLPVIISGGVILLFLIAGVLVVRYVAKRTPIDHPPRIDQAKSLIELMPQEWRDRLSALRKPGEPRLPETETLEAERGQLEKLPEPTEEQLVGLSVQTRDTLRLRYNQGVLKFYKGDTAGALAAFRSVLDIDPQQVYGRRAFIQMGIIYDLSGDSPQAITALKQALALDENDPVARHNLGLAYFHAHQPAAAVTELRRAEELDAASSIILRDLGNACEAKGDLEGATKAYTSSLSLNDTAADVHFNLGLIHYRQEQYKQAQEQFDAARRGFTGELAARADAFLGLSLYQRGELGAAAEAFERAAKLSASPADYLFNAGVAYGRSGLREEATGAFKRLVALSPQDAEAWFGLGGVLYLAGKRDEALAAYQQGLTFDTQATGPLFTVGYLEYEKGNLAAAAAHFQRVISLGGPDAPRAHVNLGLCLEAEGKLAEAEREYSAGDQSDPRTFYNLGLVRRKQKNLEGAVEAFNRAVELKPSEPRYAVALADAMLEIDRPEEALSKYEAAVTNGGGTFDLFLRLAQLTLRLEKVDQTEQWTQKAVQAAATPAEKAKAFLAQGLLKDRQGDEEAALAAMRQAAAADRGNPDIYYNLGVIEARLGGWDAAVDALRVAIKLNPDNAPAWTELGNIFFSRGLYSEASAAYDQAVKIDSNAIEAVFNLQKATAAQNAANEAPLAPEPSGSRLRDTATGAALPVAVPTGGAHASTATAEPHGPAPPAGPAPGHGSAAPAGAAHGPAAPAHGPAAPSGH